MKTDRWSFSAPFQSSQKNPTVHVQTVFWQHRLRTGLCPKHSLEAISHGVLCPKFQHNSKRLVHILVITRQEVWGPRVLQKMGSYTTHNILPLRSILVKASAFTRQGQGHIHSNNLRIKFSLSQSLQAYSRTWPQFTEAHKNQLWLQHNGQIRVVEQHANLAQIHFGDQIMKRKPKRRLHRPTLEPKETTEITTTIQSKRSASAQNRWEA